MILRWSISCSLLAGRVARPVASLAWMELCEAQIVLVMGDKILQTGKAKVSFEFSQRKNFRFKSNGVFHGAPMAEKPVWRPWLWLLRIGALPVMKEVKVVASIGISRFKRRCDLLEKPALKLLFYFFGQLNLLQPKNTKSRGSGGAESPKHYINRNLVSGIW